MLLALVKFAAGTILLLSGIRILRTGLWHSGHGWLERALQRAAGNPIQGFLWGTIATAVLQSSTALTVLTVGLVDGGALSFYQALSLVLGANVGTCVTVQLLTLDLDAISLPALILGSALSLHRHWRPAGAVLAGCGLIFYSLELMSTALAPFHRGNALPGFLTALGRSSWQGLLAGTMLTAFLHSSSVVTGMAMVLASREVLPLPGALSLVLGANVGTCITAILAALFSSRAAKRTALAHLLLNIGGAVAVLPFLSLVSPLLSLLSRDPAQQVANFHTLFNLFFSLVGLMALKPWARLLMRLVPD